MRIISGFLKGKKIDFLKSHTTRPLRDFIKGNIFNIIYHSNLIDIELDAANVLDLYSGVGSFGLECVSRGAKKATFVENDDTATVTLKKNINNLKIQNQTEVYSKEVIKFLDKFTKKDQFDVFFFDPPFDKNYFINELKIIKKSKIYTKKHLVIIHRESKSKDSLEKIIKIILTKTYGRSKLIFGTF